MNQKLPRSVQEILDDPKEDNGYVTKLGCARIQILLEHRLTKLESRNLYNIIIALGTLGGMLAALWRLFGG